jgi:uncharacterized protein (DUF58 family)
MIHTWRNLVGLSLYPAKVHPVFAGNPAIFPFNIFARGNRFRGDIELHHPAAPLSAADIPAGKEVVLDLQIPSRRRGYLVPGRWRIETRYPLGIFRAWCYLEGDHRCTVFPRAEPWNLETLQGSESDHSHGMPKKAVSGQDFHGIREYRPGDPMKSIHWPSLARGMEMMSREYETQANNDLWLDLEQMPGTNLELRLSQLCHASMVCSEQGRTFGVRLGNQRIGPDQGDAYLLRVLHALATFGL